jgi:hypothetical protein
MLGFFHKLYRLGLFCIGLVLQKLLERLDLLISLLDLHSVSSHQALVVIAFHELEVQVGLVEGSHSNWDVLGEILEDGATGAEISSRPKSDFSDTTEARRYGARSTR